MAAPLLEDALEGAVRAAFGGAARIVAAEPLAGDASTRRYVRLRLGGSGAPPTAVAMLLGPPRAEELGGASGGDEEPFVNVGRYLAARGLPVPAVYADATQAARLLVVEDVGDTPLFEAARGGDVAGLFGAAVDLLVTLQAAGAAHPDPACIAFQRRFDGALARAELAHFVEHGIETRHAHALPAAERTALLDALEPLAAPFEATGAGLAHRDFMAWNLHVQGGGRLRLIDFQDALLAPEAYDLASLLLDRTTGTLVPPALEEGLLDRFRRARAAAGLPLAGDLAERYRLCALQRALKVIGRFYFLERVAGKPGYLGYLPAVYAAGRRLFDALPALAAARARVTPHVPELAA